MSEILGIVADIGATNARFALATGDGTCDALVLPCANYGSILDAVKDYLHQISFEGQLSKASFAIAAPIIGDQVRMINHNWHFSIEETRKALGLESFHFMNDFEAVARSVVYLKDDEYVQIGEGTAKDKSPIGVIGPGTGLGVGSLIWTGRRYVPVPGEGGHVTMPAKTQREFEIFQHIKRQKKYRHLSAERVCCGKGLVNIYNAIREIDVRDELPARTSEEISEAAMKNECDACVETLNIMIESLGIVAGNLALTLGAFGGIYIAGGIIKQLGRFFENSSFREDFISKGRYEEYLSEIPTFVITHPFPAFEGLRMDLIDPVDL